MDEISIISTDLRYEALCDIFKEQGYNSSLCTPNTIKSPDILILPIKSTLTEKEFLKIFLKVKKSALVFTGEEDKVKKYFDGRIINYSKVESFIDRNAYITAESAMILALNKMQKSLSESECAVIGYGRIGKHLAKILKGLGSSVTVFARRKESREEAITSGVRAEGIEAISNSSFDVIFNTVPTQIIRKETSDKISSKTIVLDLASLPGGFEDEGFPIRALALPGKMMPISAGRAIFDFVQEYISNEGE